MKILVAVDGSKPSLKAVQMLIQHCDWYRETPQVELVTVHLPVPRVAKLPMREWVAFLEKHPGIKQSFEYSVMQEMSEIMAHTITLHLLDAPGRFKRFLRKHPELLDRIPKKELASYLNLSAETLSRLKKSGKI